MKRAEHKPFLPIERRAVVSLGLLYSIRLLGLFMLLPVLALHAEEYANSTPVLVGLALGVYGLTQALLQVPLGMLSDRIGRKPVIVAGLLMFGLGSVVAANATTMWAVVLGRALQGSGAIASTVLALLSDLTREEQRTRAMAFLGMSIGLTFMLALLLGPWVSAVYGVRGIFWITAGLAVAGLIIVAYSVPSVTRSSNFNGNTSTAVNLVLRVLGNRELARINFGIFTLHFVLTATFVSLPLVLRDTLGLPAAGHAWVYLGVLGSSFFAMLPLIVLAETRGRIREVFLLAVALLAVALLALASSTAHAAPFLVAMFMFFLAFNLLEANLPSLVSKMVFPAGKGTAMGVYSTCQFLGAFIGGVAGGLLMQHGGAPMVFLVIAILVVCWLCVAYPMRAPQKAQEVVLSYDGKRFQAEDLLAELSGLRGVRDVTLITAEAMAYLQVDDSEFNASSLQRFKPG